MDKSTRIAATIAVLVAAGSVPAVSHADVWFLGGSGGIQATGSTMTFGSLQASAFLVDTNNGSANMLTTDLLNGGASAAAQIGQFSSGLGVTTTGQGADNTTASPEHTMDNQLGFEFMVFRLPANYAFTSLQLDSLSGGAGTGTGDADITAWIGGNDVSDFSFFSGKTFGNILGSPSTTSLSGTRFQQLNVTTTSVCATGGEATNAAGTSAGCSDVLYTTGSGAVGQWLIVAAALSVNGSNLVDRDDNVLITQLIASAPTAAVPAPGTLALLVLGFAGLAFGRRKPIAQ